MPKAKTRKRKSSSMDVSLSYLDLNQIELVYAHHALENPGKKMPGFVQLSRKKRILELQKKNLMDLLRKTGKEYRKGPLMREFRDIESGKKVLSAFARLLSI